MAGVERATGTGRGEGSISGRDGLDVVMGAVGGEDDLRRRLAPHRGSPLPVEVPSVGDESCDNCVTEPKVEQAIELVQGWGPIDSKDFNVLPTM